jgi:hypothetical protein
VTSQDTGELGWVILLAMMISVVDDRLVIGRSHHRPRCKSSASANADASVTVHHLQPVWPHRGRWLACPRLASWNSLPQRTRAGKHKYSELSMSLNAIAVNADAGADPPVTGHRNWVVAMVNSNGPDSRPALP